MKSLCLVLFVGLAIATPAPNALRGKRVEYLLSAEFIHAIAGTDPTPRDARMTLNVNVTVDFANISKLEFSSTLTDDFHMLLQKYPVYFKYDGGMIPEIFAHPEESDQILNFKRGVLSALQVTPTGRNGRRTEWERDVLGLCESDIIESALQGEIVLTKKRKTELCRERPSFTTLIPSQIQQAKHVYGLMNAEYRIAYTDKQSFFYVRNAMLDQSEVFSPLAAREAGTVYSYSKMTLTAVKEPVEVIEPKLNPDYKTKNLPFDFDASVQAPAVDCNKETTDILRDLHLCHPSEIPLKFVGLVRTLRLCKQEELKTLWMELVLNPGQPKTVEQRKNHAYFFDALAYVGTEPALKVIAEAIQNKEYHLSSARQHELITSLTFIPFHYTSPCVILENALKMVEKTPEWQTSTLTLGSLINAVLENKRDDCTNQTDLAVQWLVNKLNENLELIPADFSFEKETLPESRKAWKSAIDTIKALGNAGVPKTMSTLKMVAKESKLLTVGRTAAVYALKKIGKRSPSQVRDICLSIYLDVTEEEEVRLAAFQTFMSTIQPDLPISLPTMIRMMYQVASEPKLSLKSYICRYLTQMRKTTEPRSMYRKGVIIAAMKMSNAFVSCSVSKFECFSSSHLRGYKSFADLPLPRRLPRDVLGAGIRFGFYSPDGETIPRSAYGKITAHAFGYDMDLLELGVRGTGTRRLIQQLFGPVGYFREWTRQVKKSGLQLPKNMSLDLKSLEENMTFSGLVKILGNELVWDHVEQPSIMRLLYGNDQINSVRPIMSDIMTNDFTFYQLPRLIKAWRNSIQYDQPKTWFETVKQKFSQGISSAWKIWEYLTKGVYPVGGGEINIVKTGSFLDVKRTLPTILGFPLDMTAVGVGHFGLDAEGHMIYVADEKSLGKEDRFETSGSVNPRLSVMTEFDIVLNAYFTKPKLVLFANGTSNFTQSGRTIIHNNLTLNIQLNEMPEGDSTLFNASYDQYMEKDDKRFPMSIEKSKTAHIFDRACDNILGIMVMADISHAYYKGMDGKAISGAPWFPLNGPANMNLTLRRVLPVKMINITFFNVSRLVSRNGTYNATIEAVGTPLRISANVSWDWFNRLRVVKVNVSSKPGFFYTEINTTDFSDKTTTREVWINSTLKTDTHYNNVTVYVRGGRFAGMIRRKLHTQRENKGLIKPLTEFSLKVNGTVNGRKYVNVSMYLFNKDSRLTHHLHSSVSLNLTHLNLTVNTTLLKKNINVSYCFLPEVRRGFCHAFGNHFVTFDGLKYNAELDPEIEYVLARHRHPNDTFAVTRKGKNIYVYLNETVYTLTPEGTHFRIETAMVSLPYKVHRTIYVRKVSHNGLEYVRLSAFSGIDILYNADDVTISISRFFRNQTAGLCGNSNANGTKIDELELPNYQIIEDVLEFVQSWEVRSTKTSTVPLKQICPQTTVEAVEKCQELFFISMKTGHASIDFKPYYNACLCDVSRGKDLEPSLRAYIKAAFIHGSSLDDCTYGEWKEWSKCSEGKQNRNRSFINRRLDESICSKTTQIRRCDESVPVSPICPEEKVHVFQKYGAKICKSRHRFRSCGPCCEAVLEETPSRDEFHCIPLNDEVFKFTYVSPVYLSHFRVDRCIPKDDFQKCISE
eukprot:m.306011 g.306011  ORF g.306011 m.306011 type:complete len:1615 (+) comp40899_c0_seq1:1245-6089(+)